MNLRREEIDPHTQEKEPMLTTLGSPTSNMLRIERLAASSPRFRDGHTYVPILFFQPDRFEDLHILYPRG